MCDCKIDVCETFLAQEPLSCCEATNYYRALLKYAVNTADFRAAKDIVVRHDLGLALAPEEQLFYEAQAKYHKIVKKYYDDLAACNKACCADGALAFTILAYATYRMMSVLFVLGASNVYAKVLSELRLHGDFILDMVDATEGDAKQPCKTKYINTNIRPIAIDLVTTNILDVLTLKQVDVVSCCGAIVLSYAYIMVRVVQWLADNILQLGDRVLPNMPKRIELFADGISKAMVEVRKYFRDLACCKTPCCKKTAEALAILANDMLTNTLGYVVLGAGIQVIQNGPKFDFVYKDDQVEAALAIPLRKFAKDAQELLENAGCC